MVVVKQIIHIKKKVRITLGEKDGNAMSVVLQVVATLNRLEMVASFSEFVKLFGIYGSQMVELAHLTGDRQNVKLIVVSSLMFINFVFRI